MGILVVGNAITVLGIGYAWVMTAPPRRRRLHQHRLIASTPAVTPALPGLHASTIYVRLALGSSLGGLAQEWFTLAPSRWSSPPPASRP